MFDSIVEAVFHHAGRQPDKLCLADDFRSVTYREYAETICRYANLFEKLGISREGYVVV